MSDSDEGRWTCMAAIETSTPAPLLTTALYERFSSRGVVMARSGTDGIYGSGTTRVVRKRVASGPWTMNVDRP